jgi:hypothetical protein
MKTRDRGPLPHRTYVPDVRRAVKLGAEWLAGHRGVTPDETTRRLRLLKEMRTEVDRALMDAVEEAIARRTTWAVIAEILEVSPQAAHQRYAATVRLRMEKRRARRDTGSA